MERLRILISAYACEPGKGSEPGVGWNAVMEIAKFHQIWVITRTNNRSLIESIPPDSLSQNIKFVYYDLPLWIRRWKRWEWTVQVYYYLWQIGVYPVAKELHQTINFHLTHHLTFGKYWAPSLLVGLPVPFILGPVGGGESAPRSFWKSFGLRGMMYECARNTARFFGERDPLVRKMISNAYLALTPSKDTAGRLTKLGVRNIEFVPGQTGLNEPDLNFLTTQSLPPPGPIRFVSICRLIHWKGVHLALCAFAHSKIADAEYWIIGDGPERKRLEALAVKLGIKTQVHFWGNLPRVVTLEKLADCHILLHPSLHDFSPTVCIEAMAAGRPVICLDLGGPGFQVTGETGVKILPSNPEQTIADFALAMRQLAKDPKKREEMGRKGRERASTEYTWANLGKIFNSFYTKVAGETFMSKKVRKI